MKIGLLGHGVVGAGVYEMCSSSGHFDIHSVLCLRPQDVPDGKGVADAAAMLDDPTVETVVEVLGGLHPAYELVCTAMRNGKNVVTANKHLVCQYYKELTALAASCGVGFRCTAAVGGGIPWLVNLERARRCDTITRVGGILNGTTNFILDAMHRSPLSFSDALAEAQRLGYAEADPGADIDGLDIRRKLVISANVAFDTMLTEADVLTFGIRSITDGDIAAFTAHGLVCRLLADAGSQSDGSLYAVVEPCLPGRDHPEASVSSNYNLISMWGRAIGRESFFGQGAGRAPTAYTVVQDLEDLRAGTNRFYTTLSQARPVDNTQLRRRYYLRTVAESDWLTAHTQTRWENGAVITDGVSPAELHAAAQQLQHDDPALFFAALI